MIRDRLSLFFLGVMVITTGYFLLWGFNHTGGAYPVLFVLATIFGLFMAFNIGGNDVANSFGTSVGAGTLTIKQALAVAAVFEVSGAMIAGGAVTDTIRKGIVDLGTLTAHPSFDPIDFVFVMMAALLAAAVWLLIATKRGWPVSTTHSIVGGIVGGSIALGAYVSGPNAALGLVQWGKVGSIAASWVLSPVLGGLVSFLLFSQIKRHILGYNDQAKQRLVEIEQRTRELQDRHRAGLERMSDSEKIVEHARMARDAANLQMFDDTDHRPQFESKYYAELEVLRSERDVVDSHKALVVFVPLLAAMASMVMTAMLLYKGLHNIQLGLTDLHNLLIMAMVAAGVWMVLYILARNSRVRSLDRSTFILFSWMQVFTAAGFAFSHGSNDIANAIGPFAAVLDVFHNGRINPTSPVPSVAMFAFGVALIAGLWFIGKEVIATVGTHLTKMHPASGFSAEIAAAAVVLLASAFGIPVSSTHILVGAVLGIGLANGATNWNLMKPIGLAWVITLPASAGMSALGFVVLRAIF